MSELFISVLNMSLTASYVILIVMLVRMLLKKAPKVISYALWSVVAFRLIIPFSFESVFSLLPRKTNFDPISYNIVYQQSSKINGGIEAVDTYINNSLPALTLETSVNPLQVYMEIGSYVWILGILALFVYSIVSVQKLKRQLKDAQLIEKNIFLVKNLKTPFVLGLLRPRIYLPEGLSKEEQNYILMHENTHIQRKDHIIKTLAFLIASIHWFNPLVWVAFMLMSTDMELSCDERVLKMMDGDIKKPYAHSLLSLAVERHILNGNPLAFGEGNVKGRIKNVLNYKKPRFWVVVSSVIIVAAVGAGLIVNPKAEGTEQIKDIAWDFINNEIAKYESNRGVNIVDSKIIRLERIETFEKIADAPIDVYALEYRLLPEDLSKVGLAGGMETDENGWLKEKSSMGSPLLVVSRKNTMAKFIGTLWTVGVKEDGGLESAVKKLLNEKSEIDVEILVEDNLAIIMSPPQEKSDPKVYIEAHQKEYELIIKLGGEEALKYMLSQFERGNAEGLRGYIMMELCKELLGVRNNVADGTLTPQEWYEALSIRLEVKLPDFKYDGNDPIEKLVYATEIEMHSQPQRGFTIVAPKIFGSFEEEGKLKVFVTTFNATYRLYGNVLEMESGSVVPAAITFKKDNNGNYVLEKYEQARDGADWLPSIKKFCTMPVSGKTIPGLAEKIVEHYGNDEDIHSLHYENLFKHLKANGIKEAILYNPSGEIEFSMTSPQYTN